MRKNFGTLLIGVVFLIFGGGYVVARLLGYDPPFFFDGWWTLFLMIPAVISMVETGVHVGNSIILVVGLLLLAGAQGWIENLTSPWFWRWCWCCWGSISWSGRGGRPGEDGFLRDPAPVERR